MTESELRKCFDAFMAPEADYLLLVLSSIQKDGYPQGYDYWIDFVFDVCGAMEAHDCGLFPDDWFPVESESC